MLGEGNRKIKKENHIEENRVKKSKTFPTKSGCAIYISSVVTTDNNNINWHIEH